MYFSGVPRKIRQSNTLWSGLHLSPPATGYFRWQKISDFLIETLALHTEIRCCVNENFRRKNKVLLGKTIQRRKETKVFLGVAGKYPNQQKLPSPSTANHQWPVCPSLATPGLSLLADFSNGYKATIGQAREGQYCAMLGKACCHNNAYTGRPYYFHAHFWRSVQSLGLMRVVWLTLGLIFAFYVPLHRKYLSPALK